MKEVPPRNKSPITKLCLLLTLVVLPLACTILGQPFGGAASVPVNAWNADRGPVVPHDRFPDDCRICHQGEGWHDIRKDFEFDHEKETGLELEGAHAKAECLRCHNDRGPVEAFAARGCSGCHEDFHKGQLGSDCKSCHDQKTWQAKDVIAKHSMTRFPLIGAHAGVGCWTCHPGAQVGEFKRASTDCLTCHKEDLARAQDPDHAANGWTRDCQRCHAPTTWQASGFVHSFFPLTGEHKAARCTDCHKNGQFTGLSQECASCHSAEFRSATNPDHLQAGFSNDCRKCHGSQGWKGGNYKHSWPLVGAHLAPTCQGCHAEGNYRLAKKDCVSCHRDDYQGTTEPNHSKAGYSLDCSICHQATGWKGANFRHQWPLTGSHAGRICEDCHKGGNFKNARKDCISCHRSEYDRTSKPNHLKANFGTNCQLCHNTIGWGGGNFTHKWPLQGAHAALSCTPCHQGGAFEGISKECISCHQAEYNRTTTPNHKQANFSTDCTQCHIAIGWRGANFKHPWPLLGAHVATSCVKCHKGQVYKGTPTDCYGCHKADYDGTTQPNHKNAGFSTQCTKCHNNVGWKGANFQHRWALTGAHTAVSCDSCHKGQVYQGTPNTCVGCHLPAYNGTTNPNHRNAGYTTECTVCHTTATWKGAKFDHKWPLQGGHAGQTCTKCHANNVYKGTPTDCYACHQAKYAATTAPNHQKALFSKACQTCHGINTWQGANWTHQWQLAGAHAAVPCAKCHATQVYKGTPQDCYSCHQAQYQATTNPNHAKASFPTTCQTCHGVSTWKGAKFTHTWPLNGAHVATSCLKCHVGQVYKGTAKDCYSCHKTQYDNTTNPNHRGLGYPTDCTSCHTTSAWKPSTFVHKFPLREKHAVSCKTCHTVPTNYKSFSCIVCHEHNQSKMDDKHKGKKGYVYSSPACYNCHPQGKH